MKAVILAGGLGTRLSEETDIRPKPLVEIGGRPILWHVMKIYAAGGISEFIICCGYKGSMIKKYFADYMIETSDLTIDLGSDSVHYHNRSAENWKVTLIDTGTDTMTGGRIKRIIPYVGEETFCLTYGDGVADIDIRALVAFHKSQAKMATVTAVPSPGRFGILDLDASDKVTRFHEKPTNEMGWINGGFFVLEPAAAAHIEGDASVWERKPLETLAAAGQLSAWRHEGFWKPMDTLRDKRELDELWASGRAPWKVW